MSLLIGFEYSLFDYDLSSRYNFKTPYIVAGIGYFDYMAPKSRKAEKEYKFVKNRSFSVPIGIGYKSRITHKLSFSIESVARYTFTDHLDYPKKVIKTINFKGNGNDWYLFTGVSIVYDFGNKYYGTRF